MIDYCVTLRCWVEDEGRESNQKDIWKADLKNAMKKDSTDDVAVAAAVVEGTGIHRWQDD